MLSLRAQALVHARRPVLMYLLHCEEAGRFDPLQCSIQLLDQWLIDHQSDRGLRQIIAECASGRGGMALLEIICFMKVRYFRLAARK